MRPNPYEDANISILLRLSEIRTEESAQAAGVILAWLMDVDQLYVIAAKATDYSGQRRID